MSYVPPFSQLRGHLHLSSIDGELLASVKLDEIEKFVRALLCAVPVDEAWYRKNYPDIDAAIRQGSIASAREHFVRDGYFEGRRPFAMTVDEDWYLSNYSDIASAVSAGTFPSAEEHFAAHGYEEGRVPHRLL